MAEGAHFGAAKEEIHALALVDPLLTTGGGVHEPSPVDAEGRGVAAFQIHGDFFDPFDLAVHVLELVLDLVGPEAALLEVADEVGIQHHEVTGQVGLHEHVAHERLDARAAAHDVGDRRCRGDGKDVAVTHALFGDFGAEAGPVHFAATWDFDVNAALLRKKIDRVLGKQTTIPFAALVGGILATLSGKVAGGFVGVVSDGFHHLVVELDGFLGREGDTFAIEGILKAHDAETDGAVAGVGGFGGFGRVEIDVDDVVESTHGATNGFAQAGVIDVARFVEVIVDEHRAEVANGGLIGGGVQRDLSAEVGAVDDAHVVLGAADVAGVLEGHPGMAGFEDGLEHLLPEIDGRDLASEDLAGLGEGFVLFVARFKGTAVQLMQVGDFVGAEESPIATGFHALHEEVGNPVGGVEVVGAAAFVTGVHPKLEEVFDVVVPNFEVGTARATAFATLVHGDELVIVQFQERDDALRFPIGTFDVAAGAAHGRPGAAKAACPFGKESIFGDAAVHDGLDAVVHLVEVAGGELAMQGAAVEERGRAGAEPAAFVHAVDADDFVLRGLFLGNIQAHGDTHPEELGGFEPLGGFDFLIDDEVAVVEGLDAQEVKVEVRGRVQGVSKLVEIKLKQAWVVAVDFDPTAQVAAEGAAVVFLELIDAIADDVPGEHFFVDVGEKDAACEFAEVSITLHERFCIENDGLLEVVQRDVAVDGAAQFHLDLMAGEAEIEAEHAEVDAFLQVGAIPKEGFAIGGFDKDQGLLLLAVLLGGDGGFSFLRFTHFGAQGSILDVGTGYFEEALLHQLLLDEVLHVFDVDELFVFLSDEAADGLGDTDCRGGVHFQGKEGLADGDLDLVVVPGHELSAAADDFGVHDQRLRGRGLAQGVVFGVVLAFFSQGASDIVSIVFH